MSEFHRMTVVAATEVISAFKSHSEMEVLEFQWGLDGRCSSSSKPARVVSLARICDAELHRLQAELHVARGDRTVANTSLTTALEIATAQQAKAWIARAEATHSQW